MKFIFNENCVNKKEKNLVHEQDKRKVKCTTCKHANLLVVQPVVCHLHDYTGSPHSPIALNDKVDFFFAYDLTRLTLEAVTADSNGLALRSYTPKCSSLSESVGSHSDYPLEHVLFRTAQDFHGKYGEFVIASRDDAEDVNQVTRSNYQDTVMEMNRVEYLRDGRSIHKEGSWFYGEPAGSIISRGYDEEASAGGEATAPGCSSPPTGTFDGYTFVVYHVSRLKSMTLFSFPNPEVGNSIRHSLPSTRTRSQ